MPPFPKPRFMYRYEAAKEIAALDRYLRTEPGRALPKRTRSNLLLVTWNIANLGVQKRTPAAYKIIASIIERFDVAAIQEVNDNLEGLRAIHKELPTGYRLLISDAAGNNERAAFAYDSQRVALMEKVGEIAIPPSEFRHIRAPGIKGHFEGFDRNPYLAAFEAKSFSFLLANVHLFFGSEGKKDVDRRALETYAVARWAHNRQKSKYSYTKDIIALGDFNLPKVSSDDPIYQALTRRGLELPKHSTEIGSSISRDKHYDQVAFFPEHTQKDFTGRAGVIDFDGALFKRLWERRPKSQFFAYLRYYISDHRPLWAEFKTET